LASPEIIGGRMKKGIIVLLIAVLASSFAFATLSGSAGVKLGADLDKKTFLTLNAQSLSFSFTFGSESVEIAGEDIHVEVAASAKIILGKYKGGVNGVEIVADNLSDRGFGVVASLDTAKIVGKDWYVSVLGTQSAYDYAKAAVLQINDKTNSDDFGNDYFTDDHKTAATYVAGYTKLPGVTVGYKGFTASVGVDYAKDADGDSLFIASSSVETPEFAFNDDAVKVQAALEGNRFAFDVTTEKAKAAVNVLGASAKTTVAIQDITVGVAADMGIENIGAEYEGQAEKDTEFNVDARVDFQDDFVDVNGYTYAGKAGLEFDTKKELLLLEGYDFYKDFYLEAKAAFDLNAFELPLKVTVSAKNITNSDVVYFITGNIEKGGIAPSVKVEYAKDAITAAASFEINTESKIWNTLVYGTYAFEKFTAGAGVKVAGGKDDLTQISFGAFAESDKLVEKATFGLSYGLDGGKCYSDGCAAALSGAKFSSDYKKETAGTINAYCKITF
jgi:hypothetical protein